MPAERAVNGVTLAGLATNTIGWVARFDAGGRINTFYKVCSTGHYKKSVAKRRLFDYNRIIR